jgi:hypothetical protein
VRANYPTALTGCVDEAFRVCVRTGKRNRRSLHYATPDFLSRLVALANIMRLSLKKGAHAVFSGAAWQEIRVRSGREDKFVTKLETILHGNGPLLSHKFVISTGGVMGLRPTKVMKNAFSPETTLHRKVAVSFVIPRSRLACGKLREE